MMLYCAFRISISSSFMTSVSASLSSLASVRNFSIAFIKSPKPSMQCFPSPSAINRVFFEALLLAGVGGDDDLLRYVFCVSMQTVWENNELTFLLPLFV